MATPFSDTETAVDEAFDLPPPQTLQQDNIPANPYPYTSFEEAYEALAIQSQQLGFSILKKRSNNRHPATGEYRRHDFHCSQGKKAPSKATVRKRRVASIKRDCPWKAKALRGPSGNWKVEIFVPTHNHDLEEDAQLFPNNRRRARDAPAVQIDLEAYAQLPSLYASDIAAAIGKKHEIDITAQDVRNIYNRRSAVECAGLTRTQQFLHKLWTMPGLVHTIYRSPDTGRIERVFWTYPWCIEMWRKSPEVWSMDCTYKVNRFDMPLLQISGVTNLHTTVNLAYALLSGEKEDSFDWVFKQIQQLLVDHSISQPQVIITDFDKALKRAARASFNDGCQHQLCVWHIMKNVCHNVRTKWLGALEGSALGEAGGGDGSHLRPDGDEEGDTVDLSITSHVATRLLDAGDLRQHQAGIRTGKAHQKLYGHAPVSSSRRWLDSPDGILAAWSAVVYSDTETDFLKQWQILQHEFSHQPKIVSYLADTYLPYRYEFAHFHIKHHRNFGVRVTSRTEGLHGILKDFIKSRNIDLYTLFKAVVEALDRQEKNYRVRLLRERTRPYKHNNKDTMKELYYVVSQVALDLMAEQVNLADKWKQEQQDPPLCSGAFSRQYGLPCAHSIYPLLLLRQPLDLDTVDPHWRLKGNDRPAEDFLQLRRERDPQIVNKRRWEAKNGPQPVPGSTSTKCEPSHDAPATKKRARGSQSTEQRLHSTPQGKTFPSQLTSVNGLNHHVAIATARLPATAPALPPVPPQLKRARGRAGQYGGTVFRL